MNMCGDMFIIGGKLLGLRIMDASHIVFKSSGLNDANFKLFRNISRKSSHRVLNSIIRPVG